MDSSLDWGQDQERRLEIEHLRAVESRTAALSPREAARWRRLAGEFDELRRPRLSAYVFRLTGGEVEAALDGPRAGPLPRPAVEDRDGGWRR